MLTSDALHVLALGPGATSSEIKEAYRDLVKVWHPDRFGNDLRLRQKADLQLKLINEAYRMLQSRADTDGLHGARAESTMSGASYAARPRGPGRSSRSGVSVGWIYGGLGVLVIVLMGYLVTERGWRQGAGSLPDSASQQPAGIANQQIPDASRGGRSRGLRGAVRSSNDNGRQSYRLRSFSEAETDRLETLSSKQKQSGGQVAYRSCLKAQLDLMTNPTGKPDLSALSDVERGSIESACSQARLHGLASRNRCEAEQVASLAAETAIPDLSILKETDRHPIEAACANVKNREGPAAYNRCLDRVIKTLIEVR